jgi:hypothetical protein
MNKQQTIDTLRTQLPGFYSVEQVIAIINGIREPKTSTTPFLSEMLEQIDELVCTITDDITSLGMDAIDDYDFSLNGREIELDSVEVNYSSIKDVINNGINYFINNLKQEDEDCDC